ncbi:MAG: hypothetical protein Kow0056_10310 [Coriobacteriia bacterium]
MASRIADLMLRALSAAGRGMTALLERTPKRVLITLAALLVALLLLAGVGLTFASQPHYLGEYADLADNAESLAESVHSGVGCVDCHADGRGLKRSAALVGEFYRGLITDADSPAFVNLATPTNEACLSCHEEDWSYDESRTVEIPHPAHLRVANETRECVECHKWTAHEETYIERHKTMPFSRVCASFGCHAGWKSTDECITCHHAVEEEGAQWQLDHRDVVRQIGPNACLEVCHDADQCRQCHTTGVRPEFPEIGPDKGLRAIEAEHVKEDWIERHGSFASQDDSKCFACHVSPAECQDCHSIRPDFHGLESTWLNRHQEVAEGDEQRCLTCHEQQYCDECHDQFKETSR